MTRQPGNSRKIRSNSLSHTPNTCISAGSKCPGDA